MLKRTAAAAAAIACSLCMCISAVGDTEITKSGINTDGEEYTFKDAPFKQEGNVYVPLDEALPYEGFTLGWSGAAGATVCEKDGVPNSMVFPSGDTHLVGYGMYRYIHPVINVDGKCFINKDMFSDIAGKEITARDDIDAWHIPDTYRKQENDIQKYGAEYILNRDYIFEPVVISNESVIAYADIVNRIAAKVPEAHVYNMLMPDSGEYYAPSQYYCNQNAAIEAVFDRLINVTPVRTAMALYEHADENIYFRTDHHWTQRGAYYAWKAFMEQKGESVPELSEFKTVNADDFTGYFALNIPGASAEDVLDNTKELLERFVPIQKNSAKVYDDMRQEKYAATVPVVDTSKDDYGTFLYADCPLTVMDGGVNNGKKLVIFKESMGNALATWAINNYQTVYVVDIRAFKDGSFDIGEFYNLNHFDDLLIESYPNTIESSDLRAGLESLIGKN